ncbi:MAG: aminoacyl-tRNA hydrolase, partial [Phycisphaerales bacterium]|nr:aminoacyl-tRNA hydrolase [Phycisphaerales bacterium]
MTDLPPPILPPALIEVGRVRVPVAAVRVQYSRSSGPGGQHVNKTSTRCELWLAVSAIVGMTEAAQARLREAAASKLTQADEIHIAADESRSQEGNRSMALDRLRELIVRAIVEPKRRRKTKPSYGSKMRRLEGKKRR